MQPGTRTHALRHKRLDLLVQGQGSGAGNNGAGSGGLGGGARHAGAQLRRHRRRNGRRIREPAVRAGWDHQVRVCVL